MESYIFNLQATDKFAAQLAKWENREEVVSPVDFIFINLHKRGVEKYSWEAARIVQSVLVSHLGARNRNRSAPDKMVRRAPFRVLVDTQMPALLVELGYLSNKSEYKKLNSPTYQDKVANALLRAIQQFDQVDTRCEQLVLLHSSVNTDLVGLHEGPYKLCTVFYVEGSEIGGGKSLIFGVTWGSVNERFCG